MLIAIKKLSPDGKIPRGLLMSGKPAIRNTFKEFQLSKDLDRDNEKFPHPMSPKGESPLSAYKKHM